MPRRFDPAERGATLAFWMLAAFLVILWIAGGASRADVAGQAVVRGWAWATMLAAAVLLPRPDFQAIRVPAIVLGLATLLLAVQLVPLPPAVWQALPGRMVFIAAGDIAGAPGLWRPVSISPDGTWNAIQSLVVPAAVLLLISYLSRAQHDRLIGLILALVLAGSVLGIIQFAGARIANPFINDQAPAVSGNFANRNHFALFLAIGCVFAPIWALGERPQRWKAALALALVILFALMILATGSRAGMVVGAVAIAVSFTLMGARLRRSFSGLSSRAVMIAAGIAVMLLVGAVLLSISLDRAAAIARVSMIENEAEIRGRIWPVVIDMTQRYFPVGSGFGTFDAAFRISEPDQLLGPTYVNQAHSDWLQVVLEGGVVGGALLLFALGWLTLRGIDLWRAGDDVGRTRGRAGLTVILLVLIASIPDYPARTPMVMAMLAIAAVWIAPSARARGRAAAAGAERDALPSARRGL